MGSVVNLRESTGYSFSFQGGIVITACSWRLCVDLRSLLGMSCDSPRRLLTRGLSHQEKETDGSISFIGINGKLKRNVLEVGDPRESQNELGGSKEDLNPWPLG